jgi:hypothetical protein
MIKRLEFDIMQLSEEKNERKRMNEILYANSSLTKEKIE